MVEDNERRQIIYPAPIPLPAREIEDVEEGEEDGIDGEAPDQESGEQPGAGTKSDFPETQLTDEAAEEIFGLDDEDIMGGSDDFSDILEVSNEDIMGGPRLRKPQRVKRTPKRYVSPSPSPSLGGMQQ